LRHSLSGFLPVPTRKAFFSFCGFLSTRGGSPTESKFVRFLCVAFFPSFFYVLLYIFGQHQVEALQGAAKTPELIASGFFDSSL